MKVLQFVSAILLVLIRVIKKKKEKNIFIYIFFDSYYINEYLYITIKYKNGGII